MKSSLGKQLKRFSLSKTSSDVGGGSTSAAKEKKDHQHHPALAHLEALSQEMKEMRDCCDALLSAAAATANSAYEFSVSLLEMGNCLLETTALDSDGECGIALSVLGKAQLEIQKLVDSYRTNVILTITNPSESLLSELRKVEEMKQQCDEKRYIYEHMVAQHSDKGKSRTAKGERITSQQLQAAREEYDDAARLCIFRVESLKQGQCRSLLTQAARHHTAQLVFFRKGLRSLEAVEPYMKSVAQNQHILTDLDEAEDVQDSDVSYYDGELSFDNNRNKQDRENAGFSRNSTELDTSRVDASLPQSSGLDDVELNFGTKKGEQVFSKKTQLSYHSAPIYADKFDASEKIRETQTPVQKFHAYALPTPADARNSHSRTSSSILHSNTASVSGSNNNLWHSTPLDAEKARKFMDDNSATGFAAKAQSGTKDGDQDNSSIPLPFPMMEGVSFTQFDTHNGYDVKKVNRQAFSGPLLSKPPSSKPLLSSSGPIERLQVVAGMPPRVSTSHHAPQSVSPPLASSPKISELHELPRPPGGIPNKAVSYSGLVGHSAPLGNRKREVSPTNRSSFPATSGGSPLPTPPLTVSRSFSIPSSKHRVAATQLLERHEMKEKVEEVVSPPLTPIPMSNLKPATVVSELVSSLGR